MAFLGDNGYDYDPRGRRGHSPRGYYDDNYRRSQQFLDPRLGGGGLHRTKSTGHQPAPNIYIYNDQIQDAQQRSGSPFAPHPAVPPPPPPAPQAIPVPYAVPVPPQAIPVPYPAVSPSFRGRRLGDELVEDLADMALHDRAARSRSRGRSDLGGDRSDWYQWELARKERELDEEHRKQLAEKDWELRRMRDDEKRRRRLSGQEAEEKRILAEYEEKQRQKVADAKEAELRFMEKMEREKREKKEEEERMKAKFKQEEEDRKQKEKEEWEEFERKRLAKEEKEKADKKAAKEAFEHEMRRRLESFGVYSQQQIDYMVDEEKAKKYKERSRSGTRTTTTTTRKEVDIWRPSRPVYPKIHRDYIEIETLTYYGVPWEYDLDPNYIILKREMDKYETDVLFEHTRRIRAGDRTLLIEEAPRNQKNYAWYRKRDRSSSRVRKVGILEVRKVV